MSGELERFVARRPTELDKQMNLMFEGQRVAMLASRNQAALALTKLELAALVAHGGMNASRYLHLAADQHANQVPSCTEGVEMMAQGFDVGATMTIQRLFGTTFG